MEDARLELAREADQGSVASWCPSDATLKGSPWPFCSRSRAPERDLDSFGALSSSPSPIVRSFSISRRSGGKAVPGSWAEGN